MKRVAVLAIILFALAALLPFQYLRPVSPVAATLLVPAKERVPGEAPTLMWPTRAAAAVSVVGLGSLGAHSDSTPRPMASVAKVMTALVVLDDHPLADLDPGPPIAIQPGDVQEYQANLADGQSVVKVVEGEVLSEFQLLEGLLIPSGNNLAGVLARWDAGSTDGFVARMNLKGIALGMKRTHFADASGFSERTVGTAGDLVLVGEALMANPVLARIVGQGQADLPVIGTVFNVDYALGSEGIVGIKTGAAPRAG
ncbi:MAG: D-alanyl-D-alanine carboxypeptidase, partial [Candidatus Dormibacteraeota bacterium]|nr:D-alanyl-D-alanine carboxypeptidase [Candidatus Dormibacteraeota bacterium]